MKKRATTQEERRRGQKKRGTHKHTSATLMVLLHGGEDLQLFWIELVNRKGGHTSHDEIFSLMFSTGKISLALPTLSHATTTAVVAEMWWRQVHAGW
jgi:hypothetical protein